METEEDQHKGKAAEAPAGAEAVKRPRSDSLSSSGSSSASSGSASGSESSSSYSSSISAKSASSDDEEEKKKVVGEGPEDDFSRQLAVQDHAVHGVNPQNLIEKILRDKIFETMYWKEHCFALTASTLVDKAMDLKEAGATEGQLRHPLPFIMLVMRMLQIQPEREIVIEFIQNEDFRYVRLLGAFYWRLVASPADAYRFIEPLYNDYRKVVCVDSHGRVIRHVDEVAWDLLHSELCLDVTLPRIPKRAVLEQAGVLPPRASPLDSEPDVVALRAQYASTQAPPPS